MFRQRTVTGIPACHIFRKWKAYVDNSLGFVIGFMEGITANTGEFNELGLGQTKAVSPVMGFIHCIPNLDASAIPLYMMHSDFLCTDPELLIVFFLEPLRIDFRVPKPKGMAFSLNMVLLQKPQSLVNVFVLVLSFLWNSSPRIEWKSGKIKELFKKFGIPCPRRNKPVKIASQ